jgi:aspartyl-tRNA synthetase
MQIFEMKTGRFTPLSDDVLAKFNPEQLVAYNDLAVAVSELGVADVEVENAADANRAAVAALHEAEAIEAKKPKYSFLDARRDAIASYRKAHP